MQDIKIKKYNRQCFKNSESISNHCNEHFQILKSIRITHAGSVSSPTREAVSLPVSKPISEPVSEPESEPESEPVSEPISLPVS